MVFKCEGRGMNYAIGGISLAMACFAFSASVIRAYVGNSQKSAENEYMFIGYLLIAAICFK